MNQQEARKRWRVPTSVCAVCLVLLLALAWFLNTYATPEGMWDEPRLGNEGFAYYEIHDGKFEFVVEEEGRLFLGKCERKEGEWVVTPNKGGSPFRLRASPWTLKMVDTNEVPIGPSCGRLFFRPQASLPSKGKLPK